MFATSQAKAEDRRKRLVITLLYSCILFDLLQ